MAEVESDKMRAYVIKRELVFSYDPYPTLTPFKIPSVFLGGVDGHRRAEILHETVVAQLPFAVPKPAEPAAPLRRWLNSACKTGYWRFYDEPVDGMKRTVVRFSDKAEAAKFRIVFG